MKYIKSVWQDIQSGQNLDVYITVMVSLVIAILGVFGIVNQSIVSSAVLATLALVSVGLLQNRRENDTLPMFELKSSKHREWIRIFQEQFEALWQEAEPLYLVEN